MVAFYRVDPHGDKSHFSGVTGPLVTKAECGGDR